MNRLGLRHPSTLIGKHNAEYSSLYQAFAEHADTNLSGSHITFRLPSTGALVGLFGVFLHTPPIGRAYLNLATALRELGHLSPRIKAILALTVGAHERSAYQLYVHRRLGERAGMTSNELDALHAGLFSQSFTNEDRAAYLIARELCVSSGPLSERAWSDGMAVLGQEGATVAVHYVAFYRYLATVSRGFDVQLPSPGERVEGHSR